MQLSELNQETVLNLRIEGELANHIQSQLASGLYENENEYVRDIIRHDMEEHTVSSIMRGYEDLGAGRVHKFKSLQNSIRRSRKRQNNSE